MVILPFAISFNRSRLKSRKTSHHFPIIQADIELIPRLGDGITHPREVFAEVGISGNGEHAKVMKDAARERLKFFIEFKEIVFSKADINPRLSVYRERT